jgi:hypothetical protein
MAKNRSSTTVTSRLEQMVKAVRGHDEVTGEMLRSVCSETKQRIKALRLRIPAGAWENLVFWNTVGRVDANLRLRKVQFVRLWKSQFAEIVKSAIVVVQEQLSREMALRRRCKKAHGGEHGSGNEVRVHLPHFLRGGKEYRFYEGKAEFWGFAGLEKEARQAYLDLKNGCLPALAIAAWF